MSGSKSNMAFVGTHTEETDDEGIHQCRIDRSTGNLERVDLTTVGETPFYQTLHPNGEFLYSVDMVDDGVVRAFSIEAESGELSQMNSRPTGDSDPCYLSVDGAGRFLLVAHYTGGSVTMFPIKADGRVGERTDLIKHEGSSVDPERQTQPHPHSIELGPENKFAYVSDLGSDQVVVYGVDAESGSLTWIDSVSLHSGAGPRHSDFHPNGRVLYVINELDSTLTTFDRDPNTGTLEKNGTVSTIPDRFTDENFPADIQVHPSGQWAYGTNRGHDSIAIYELDSTSGRAELTGHESVCGEWPWNVDFAPDGLYLLVANHDTDGLVNFRIDTDYGDLTVAGTVSGIPSPTCVTVL